MILWSRATVAAVYDFSGQAIAAATAMLGACSQYPNQGRPGYGQVAGVDINKEVIGGVVGAGLGAVTGSNVGKGRGKTAAIAISLLFCQRA